MIKRMKKRTFAGSLCQQVVWNSGRGPSIRPQRIRFKSEEERAEHSRQIARRKHKLKINNSFTTAGYWCTFTFSKENEVHTWDEARRERNNFRRRLTYKRPDAKVSLYMGRGKSTHRIHFHAFIEGLTEEEIRAAWKLGECVSISHLRAHNRSADGRDLGAVFTAVANYAFDHWTAEQGGHYYSCTDNVQLPEEEEPTECKREYSPEHPPRAPKGYIYIGGYSTPYGYLLFEYIRIPNRKSLAAGSG